LLNWCQRAFTILEVVSFIARDASSRVIEGGTLVGNGDTGSILIENPVIRAFKTDLLVPIPTSASNVRNLLGWCLAAFSLLKVISFVTGYTCSSFVKSGTLV
jgi:hypothetical protein